MVLELSKFDVHHRTAVAAAALTFLEQGAKEQIVYLLSVVRLLPSMLLPVEILKSRT